MQRSNKENRQLFIVLVVMAALLADLLLSVLLVAAHSVQSNDECPVRNFKIYEKGPNWMSLSWYPPETSKKIVSYSFKYRPKEQPEYETIHGNPTECSCRSGMLCLTLKNLTEPRERFEVVVRAVPENQLEECVEESRSVDKMEQVAAPEGLKINVLSSTSISMNFNTSTEPYGSIKWSIAEVTRLGSYLRNNSTWPNLKKVKHSSSHGCKFSIQVDDLLPSTKYRVSVHFVSQTEKESNRISEDVWTHPVEPHFRANLSLVAVSSTIGSATVMLPPAAENLTNTSAYFIVVTQEDGPSQERPPQPAFQDSSLLEKIPWNQAKINWIAAELQLESTAMNFTLGTNEITSGEFGNNYTNKYLAPGCEYSVSLTAINKQENIVKNATIYLKERIYIEKKEAEEAVLTYHWFIALLILPVVIVISWIFRRYWCKSHSGGSSSLKDLEPLHKLSESQHSPSDKHNRYDEISLSKRNLPALPVKTVQKDGYGHKVVLADLRNYVLEALASGELKRQHENCPAGNTAGCCYGQLPANKNKNRYANLAAYDDTRVILRSLQDKPSTGYSYTKLKVDPTSDYINANYIDGYKHPRMYIATQGPTPNTVPDFWHMVWQENVQIICMLTNIIESDKVKCEQYWPDPGEKGMYGPITVVTSDSQVFADFTFRYFEVSYNYIRRNVQHLHFTSWPNHGVPRYARSAALYLKHLLATPQGEGPIVVHCSAGVGRTGTVILTDINLRMAAAEGAVDILGHLRNIRKQRPNLVVNDEQYKLVHTILLECLMEEPTAVMCGADFSTRIAALRTAGEIDHQYEQLKSRCQLDQELVEYFEAESCISYGVDWNITTVSGFQFKDQFITCQLPTSTTAADFWRMILTHAISIIVVLNPFESREAEYDAWPRPMQSIRPVPGMNVSVVRTKNVVSNAQQIHQTINLSDGSTNVAVQALKLNNWPVNQEVPPTPSELLTLWEETKNLYKGRGKILVTCCDGVTACGLFVALSYLIEKMRLEQVCDVCESVRMVRQQNDSFIKSKRQFHFLYMAATEYMESFETYANFQ